MNFIAPVLEQIGIPTMHLEFYRTYGIVKTSKCVTLVALILV